MSIWLILLHMILYFLTNEEKEIFMIFFIHVYVCVHVLAHVCLLCHSQGGQKRALDPWS